MSKARIKTVLIDDSPFMLKVISDIINKDAEIDLVGTAADGREGSAMAVALKPDVVVTDMVMPEYDGMYVVRSVMEQRPVPIILLSSLEKTNSRIFDALQQGAFEFIDKPTQLTAQGIEEYRLVSLIKEASKADVRLLKGKSAPKSLPTRKRRLKGKLNYDIIAIGASTGGPSALEAIINSFPNNLSVPVVIAQHMPHRFLETFTERLNERSALRVKLAQRGEILRGGTIYIAPGDANMKVSLNHFVGQPMASFTNRKYSEFNHPSIDCLFESVATVYGGKCIGVILTGMGKDGAKGLSLMKAQGALTIAQDEASSVVYGMPKAAVDFNAVTKVVNLKEISELIIQNL